MSPEEGNVKKVPDSTLENGVMWKPNGGTETRLDIMKSWIKTCNEHHGSPCVVCKEDATAWPTWLIDTAGACIVEGNMAHRYLTLSYVWGGVQTLQLTTSNMDRLRRYGSLAKEEITLPKTIREALEITQLLEERYILVDQLCIIQDDQQHKMAEIEHMAEIYANSYLTLVAVIGSTADAGLVEYFDQWIHQSPPSEGLSGRANLDGVEYYLNHRSTWNHRGWTYQERRFAGRILYFSNTWARLWHNYDCAL